WLRPDLGGVRGVRLGHRPRRHGPHLARRLHHPRALPQPHHRGVRARRAPPAAPRRRVLHRRGEQRPRRVAPRRVAGGPQRRADARVLVLARLLRRRAGRAPARRAHPGAARLLRRAHLPPRRQAGRVPHRVVGRPDRVRRLRPSDGGRRAPARRPPSARPRRKRAGRGEDGAACGPPARTARADVAGWSGTGSPEQPRDDRRTMSRHPQDATATRMLADRTGTDPADWFLVFKARYGMEVVFRALAGTRGPGDVVTQVFTCSTAVDPILVAGLRPVYAEVSPATVAIDPDRLAVGPDTRAVVLQNTFGIVDSAGARRLRDAARSVGALLVEDSAHCVTRLARDADGSPVADVSFHSFGVEKMLPTRFGGAVWVSPALDPALRSAVVTALDALP